jgi:hypothetical protein
MRFEKSFGVLVLCSALLGCGGGAPERGEEAAAEPAATPGPTGIVEIRAAEATMPGDGDATRYEFVAPAYFPSGWVKLRFTNEGKEPHFLIIWDLPDGENAEEYGPDHVPPGYRTFDEYAAAVATPFEELYAKHRPFEPQADKQVFFDELMAAIPQWFYEAKPMGGPGFTAPGRTSEVMVHLEPGRNYVLECYVRAMTQKDSFHGSHGMLRMMEVDEERAGISPLAPPAADVEIELSGRDPASFELKVPEDLKAGTHTARIRVNDTPPGFVRHNIHLVKLEGEMTASRVAEWMDWVEQMLQPAPAVFLGGAGQTVADRVSYFDFELESGGRYAWVSEGFGIEGRGGMVREFTVE